VEACTRWLNRGLLLLALALVGWGAHGGVSAVLELPVKRVEVHGALAHLQREEIRGVVAASVGRGFVATSLRALRKELESLPWVYRASVRRRWPDTLAIRVEEQRPIARWGERGFLNHEAELFHTESAQQVRGLPLLDGPQGARVRLMQQYLALREMMASQGLQILALREDALGQISMELDAGLEVQLGDREQQQRAQRFLQLYAQELRAGDTRAIAVDLRYAAGAAVRFAPQAALAAADTGTAG
jgi:cell division protein FtsQ